jgi:hypothetical protein
MPLLATGSFASPTSSVGDGADSLANSGRRRLHKKLVGRKNVTLERIQEGWNLRRKIESREAQKPVHALILARTTGASQPQGAKEWVSGNALVLFGSPQSQAITPLSARPLRHRNLALQS